MTKNRFLIFERLAVVAIFLFVVAFAIQNLWHVVKASEERNLNNSASEYKALKKMYPEKLQTLPQSMVRLNASGAVIPQNAPIN
jgi:predicted RND superfamily exporter protein